MVIEDPTDSRIDRIDPAAVDEWMRSEDANVERLSDLAVDFIIPAITMVAGLLGQHVSTNDDATSTP